MHLSTEIDGLFVLCAIAVVFAVHKFPPGDPLGLSLRLHQIGEQVFDPHGILDLQDIELGGRFIGGAAMDGPKSPHPLPQWTV